MSDMNMNRQAGFISGMLITLIAVSVVLAGTAGFAIWAYMGRQDYKNNSDQKVEVAVADNTDKTQAADAIKYAEEAKNPLKPYIGPSAYGAVNVLYPKTWSGYVTEATTGTSTPVNNYFHPDVVRNVNDIENAFALRVQVTQQSFDKVVGTHESAIKNKKASSQPYSLPKVPGIAGVRIEGALNDKKQGTLIILPMRNLTLQIWTEGEQYKADFNNIILPNFSFAP